MPLTPSSFARPSRAFARSGSRPPPPRQRFRVLRSWVPSLDSGAPLVRDRFRDRASESPATRSPAHLGTAAELLGPLRCDRSSDRVEPHKIPALDSIQPLTRFTATDLPSSSAIEFSIREHGPRPLEPAPHRRGRHCCRTARAAIQGPGRSRCPAGSPSPPLARRRRQPLATPMRLRASTFCREPAFSEGRGALEETRAARIAPALSDRSAPEDFNHRAGPRSLRAMYPSKVLSSNETYR